MLAAEGGRVGIEIELAHQEAFELGGLMVRPPTREVACGDKVEVLQPRVMQVLVALARRQGEVVSHADLIAACWGARHVSDDALQRCVAMLRRLATSLGGFEIKSVARVGYRLDQASATGPLRATSPPSVARKASLVGRGKEMELLRELLAGALAGRGATVLVSGDPGIGKTRVCKEVTGRAEAAGASVLWGRSFAAPASEPFGPFIEMLEGVLQAWTAARLRAALGDDVAQLARLLSELRVQSDNVPAAAMRQSRRSQARALVRMLERLSAVRPIVLVFDDLHWVDEETARALGELARRGADLPVLVVGAYRDAQRDIGRPFADLLEELLRQRVVEDVPLKGLPERDTAELVVGLAGRPFARGRLVGPDPPSAQVGAIHTATQGNPFFVEEVVRHLASEGRLYDLDGCVRIDLRPDELSVSDGMRLVINKRVERISLAARRVIAAAAVIGARFAVEVLEAMDWGGKDVVLDGLGEAESAGLIRVDSRDCGFAHDLVRQAVLTTLSPPRQMRLHWQIAEAIERAYPDAVNERAAELGYHLARADAPEGDHVEVVVNRLRRAGELALAAYDFDESEIVYDAALKLQSPAPVRAELLAGRAGNWQRSPDDSIDDLAEAISIYTEVGDADAVARHSVTLAHSCWLALRNREGLAACQSAVAALGDRLTGDRAVVMASQGHFLVLLREHEAGEDLLSEAVRIATELDDARALALICALKARAHLDLHESHDAAVWGLRAGEAAKRSTQPDIASPNLTLAAGALLALGRWDEALAVIDEAEPLARLESGWHVVMHCQFIRNAIREAREAWIGDDGDRTYMRKARGMGVDAAAHRALFGNLKLAGRWEEAIQECERALLSDDRDARIVGWSGLLLMKARLGDRAGAEAMLAERWSASDSRPQYARRIRFSWLRDFAIAETLALLGRDEEAGRFYEAFLEFSRRNCPIEGLLGITAAAGRKWAAAEMHFSAALAEAERLPNRWAQADHRVAWARALLRSSEPGHRDHAESLIRDAAGRYDRMRMARHAAEARDLLAAHSKGSACVS